jgi:hypothetical protein
VDAVVGQGHWLHLNDTHKRREYDVSDFRHHFRPGVVIKIEKNCGFWVQPDQRKVPRRLYGAVTLRTAPNAVSPFVEKEGRSTLSDAPVWIPTTAHENAAELLQNAKKWLRCIEWQNVTLELFTTSPRDLDPAAKEATQAEIYALSRPLKAGENRVDLFVSHSWSDDGNYYTSLVWSIPLIFTFQQQENPGSVLCRKPPRHSSTLTADSRPCGWTSPGI